MSGFIQTFKFFSRTCFQDSKILFSRTFQKTFKSKHWLHEIRKCIYKIGYRCICIKVKKWKCNTWGCIIVFHCIKKYGLCLSAYQLLKTEIKISRSAALKFQDFPRISIVFQDFPGLEFWTIKFQDFPGSVWTL